MSIMTCQWPDCERTDIFSRGLCRRCTKRAQRAGIVDQFTAPPRLCGHCGESFLTGGKNGKHAYCSLECQRAGVSARRIEKRKAELTRPCAVCGEAISHTRRFDAVVCSEACRRAAWYRANPDKVKDANHRRRAVMRGSDAETLDFAALWERDGGKCWICGEGVDPTLSHPDPGSKSWDHVVPISAGGGHTMQNVALSHLRCNLSKHVKVLDRRPAWAS